MITIIFITVIITLFQLLHSTSLYVCMCMYVWVFVYVYVYVCVCVCVCICMCVYDYNHFSLDHSHHDDDIRNALEELQELSACLINSNNN